MLGLALGCACGSHSLTCLCSQRVVVAARRRYETACALAGHEPEDVERQVSEMRLLRAEEVACKGSSDQYGLQTARHVELRRLGRPVLRRLNAAWRDRFPGGQKAAAPRSIIDTMLRESLAGADTTVATLVRNM